MPALPHIHLAALRDLARQLRFAGAAAMARHLERLEELALQLEPQRAYPEDYLVFRITGLRPAIDEPAMIAGAAALADLSALAEHLSDAARLPAPDSAFRVDQLGERWGVSRKTIERYRRGGLIARRVRLQGGRAAVVISPAHAAAFESRHAAMLSRARGFTRLSREDRAAIVDEARRLQATHGWTRLRVARVIAGARGRSVETIRQILVLHDRRAAEPIFGDSGPPRPRERELIARATFWGLEAPALARRLERDARAVRRVAIDARAARLRGLLWSHIAPAQRDALDSPLVDEGLDVRAPRTLGAFLDEARSRSAPIGAVERAQIAATHALGVRARDAIAGLPEHGARADIVDRIETDLRWISRLKAALVDAQLGTIVRSIESALGGPVERLGGEAAVELVLGSLAAAADAIDAIELDRGGRLAGGVTVAVTRLAARAGKRLDPGSGRSALRWSGDPAMPEWKSRLCPWQWWSTRRGRSLWLEPPERVRLGAERLEGVSRSLLVRRFGWGCRPRTVLELAREERRPSVRLALTLRESMTQAWMAGA